MPISLSIAKAEQAEQLIRLICASITELCAADHTNLAEPLSQWLGNKTQDNMLRWIAAPEIFMLVAHMDDKLAGMGSVNDQGRVLMNYVHPNFRFVGVSKAIMNGLLAHCKSLDLRQATLESSKTALEFYKGCGWEVIKSTDDKIEMIKDLGAFNAESHMVI
ncbi:MAG: GNAT family N-acetyltransferase [Hyphomicrobiales bacterium]